MLKVNKVKFLVYLKKQHIQVERGLVNYLELINY
uniref:Uncharacterized protein n=1 Tax=Myoviridae sp. ctCo31 TaxID=2825053 RepID=A0A8S5UM90_9CAUD|nr:MAG TPA: hypothetical protein [Myoviridae sp. ctCo31]